MKLNSRDYFGKNKYASPNHMEESEPRSVTKVDALSKHPSFPHLKKL